MRWKSLIVVVVAAVLVAVVGCVEHQHAPPANPPGLPLWSAAPFALLLLGIAVLPLAAHHWWENHRNKALVAFGFALLAGGYLLWMGPATGGETVRRLQHALAEYASFIILLAALYVVGGGIVLSGDIRGRPQTNVLFLFVGAVLANLIGTTGASMVLIRPFLRTNSERAHTRHLPIFFIFVVSNAGGLLTPLGDPPLFLGFLRGVDFFWTLSLWPQWLLVKGVLLALFWVWDSVAYRRETPAAIRFDEVRVHPLRLGGLWPNLPLLLGILAAVVLQSPAAGRAIGGLLPGGPDLTLHKPWGEGLMVVILALSLLLTRPSLRHANRFGWGPIAEVAVLFAGIFATMVPALALLERLGPRLGIDQPWQYFWLTGGLSSFLDNAPTYLTFATAAAGGPDFAALARDRPLLLQAISCGAVFMGANTYIGNGPNFMVKAIAEEMRYKMPSFFGYMAYSACLLLPLFALVTWVFFA